MDAIVNVTPDWGIGYQGRLLVSFPEDLRHFRHMTEGKTLILGRRTLDTFPQGKPLPNRRNIILSRTPAYRVEGAEVVCSVTELFALLAPLQTQQLMVIGGQSVYRLLLDYCSKVYVTKTLLPLPADRFFPNLDQLPDWSCSLAGSVCMSNEIPYQFLEYTNRNPKTITERGSEL